MCSLIYYFNHFLRQLRFCRLFVEYSISPAICQYVRLHSTIRLPTMCFQKITYTKVNDTFFQFTRLLRQAHVSYRCIKPKRLLHYKIMYLRQFPRNALSLNTIYPRSDEPLPHNVLYHNRKCLSTYYTKTIT